MFKKNVKTYKINILTTVSIFMQTLCCDFGRSLVVSSKSLANSFVPRHFRKITNWHMRLLIVMMYVFPKREISFALDK